MKYEIKLLKEGYEEYGSETAKAKTKDGLISELLNLLYDVAGYYQVEEEE